AIWMLDGKNKLPKAVKTIVDDTSLSLYICIVSAWEIAVKISVGKLKFTGGSEVFLEKMHKNGVELLNIKISYLKYIETLPFIHRDPFDRLLIAAAKSDGMTILTSDENIHKYDAPCIW
ncbi:MAG: type II toxin-antitoxin system VapC family toxin, partial [Oscillospiraceae bacterium]|nr:type II toxin-antitoxin system VapC family toxin [Oscillospiraceae bacterium]